MTLALSSAISCASDRSLLAVNQVDVARTATKINVMARIILDCTELVAISGMAGAF
jgi:hypothetical protein